MQGENFLEHQQTCRVDIFWQILQVILIFETEKVIVNFILTCLYKFRQNCKQFLTWMTFLKINKRACTSIRHTRVWNQLENAFRN